MCKIAFDYAQAYNDTFDAFVTIKRNTSDVAIAQINSYMSLPDDYDKLFRVRNLCKKLDKIETSLENVKNLIDSL